MSNRDRPWLIVPVLAACLTGLSACDHFDVQDAASHLPPYQNTVDRPKTIIDTALDTCPDKTEDRETACVRQALSDQHVSVAALVALLPGCQAGHQCVYRHRSEDRLGYIPAIAERFVAHWRVDFDFSQAAKLATGVQITVVEE